MNFGLIMLVIFFIIPSGLIIQYNVCEHEEYTQQSPITVHFTIFG